MEEIEALSVKGFKPKENSHTQTIVFSLAAENSIYPCQHWDDEMQDCRIRQRTTMQIQMSAI